MLQLFLNSQISLLPLGFSLHFWEFLLMEDLPDVLGTQERKGLVMIRLFHHSPFTLHRTLQKGSETTSNAGHTLGIACLFNSRFLCRSFFGNPMEVWEGKERLGGEERRLMHLVPAPGLIPNLCGSAGQDVSFLAFGIPWHDRLPERTVRS